MKISLIVSTYNSSAFLRLCLESILRQKRMPDEVLVADDGSTTETSELVASYAKFFPVPLIHIWHEDKGFRLAAIRNKAILASKSEFIIQIDGDIILDSLYVNDYATNAKEGFFYSGSRAFISEERTRQMMDDTNVDLHFYSKGIRSRENAIRIPLLSPFFYTHKRLNGCSLGFWRKDLFSVNGYDEDMVGWGAEDHDIADRLRRLGIIQKHLKFQAIQYHLYHKANSRDAISHHMQILEDNRRNNIVRCRNGLYSICRTD